MLSNKFHRTALPYSHLTPRSEAFSSPPVSARSAEIAGHTRTHNILPIVTITYPGWHVKPHQPNGKVVAGPGGALSGKEIGFVLQNKRWIRQALGWVRFFKSAWERVAGGRYIIRQRTKMFSTVILLSFLTAQSNPAAAPSIDWAKAKRVFDANCAGCHGPEGVGGKGPVLAVPKLPRARTNEELAGVIVGGIPGTLMPASWHLGEEGVTLAVAYVRKLGAGATPPKVEGDAAKGQALFMGKGGCTNCHNVGYGPDLSSIGSRRTAASLRESITEPAAEVLEDFLPVRIVTREGKMAQGIRVNEDSFTIQLIEPSGRFSSFRKDSLSKLDKRVGESPMPSYKTVFSENELRDVVAYLSSLRGEQ